LAEPTTVMREMLTARRETISMTEFRSKFASADENAAWLVDCKLAAWDGDGLIALDGMGRPFTHWPKRTPGVPQNVRTPGVDKGPRGIVTIPCMAEGSKRIAKKLNDKRDAVMPRIITMVRGGAPLHKAFSAVGYKSWSAIRERKPEEWAAIEAAKQAYEDEQSALLQEFKDRLLLLVEILGRATVDQIFDHTSKWVNGKQRNKAAVGLIMRAMRAEGKIDFLRCGGSNTNQWSVKKGVAR